MEDRQHQRRNKTTPSNKLHVIFNSTFRPSNSGFSASITQNPSMAFLLFLPLLPTPPPFGFCYTNPSSQTYGRYSRLPEPGEGLIDEPVMALLGNDFSRIYEWLNCVPCCTSSSPTSWRLNEMMSVKFLLDTKSTHFAFFTGMWAPIWFPTLVPQLWGWGNVNLCIIRTLT